LALIGAWFTFGVGSYVRTAYVESAAEAAKAGTLSSEYLITKIIRKNPKQLAGISTVLGLLYLSSLADRGKMGTMRSMGDSTNKKKSLGRVDMSFFRRIRRLLAIAMPTWTCKEARYVFMLAACITLRTQMSVWLAGVNGNMV